jgi:hypothetical protein
MKVEVKPIEIPRWHGKSGQEDIRRPVVIQALVDTEKMEYATGLDNEKKFKDNKTEEAYYSKLLGQDLSKTFIPGKVHPFWDDTVSAVKLENNTMFFDPEKPLDYIKIKIMKASKYVANSMKDYEEGKFPFATHVIFDEAEEVEIRASKIELKKQAMAACNGLSKDRKIQLILILTGKNIKGKSDNFVEVELDKLIEGKAKDVVTVLNKDVAETAIKATVMEAIQKNVIRNIAGKLSYMELPLGFDVDEAVRLLNNLDQQELLIRIRAEIS